MTTPRRHAIHGVLAVLPAIALCLLASCGKREQTLKGTNEVIRRPGTYLLEGKDIKIRVWVEDLIVHYSVTKSNVSIIESFDRPSATQRWFLCWDTNDYLWFDSSDIGGTVWRPMVGIEKYGAAPLLGQPETIRSMPGAVFMAFPITLQDEWQRFRK